MLRLEDRHEREMLYGPTNEEMITEIFRAYVRSYKDVPLNLYHIQWKFRDEVRPRFGLMRGREFLMKDAYSFDVDRGGARHSYNKMFVAYLRTFARLGLKAIPMRADTGPIGGDLSTSSSSWRIPARARVFCHKDYLGFDVPGATSTSTTSRPCRARLTNGPRSRRDLRDARRGRLSGRCRRRAGVRTRHRGGPHLLFRHRGTPSR